MTIGDAASSGDPGRMAGLVQHSAQGPRDLRLVKDLPIPAPGPNECLVRVDAAGINFADVMQSRGQYHDGPRPPYVAGFEAAGEVVEVGASVVGIPVGARVVGTGPGAFAEFMTMSASELRTVPEGWTAAEALGMTLNWGTAVAALRVLGGVTEGEDVLIHAAAGGVGQAAVRAARHYGARVIGTASRSKFDTVTGLGADVVLDGRRPDLADEIRRVSAGIDLTLESVGRSTLATSLAVTRPFTGRVVVYGAASGETTVGTHDLVFRHHAQIRGLHIGALAAESPRLYRAVVDEVDRLIALGVYAPGHPRLHPLADGPGVLSALARGHTEGKHALQPRSTRK